MKRLRKLITVFMIMGLSFQASAFGHENIIYIWQKSWDENIKESLDGISSLVDHYTILSGDLKYTNSSPKINSIPIRWSYMINSNLKVTLAFRMDTASSALLKDDNIYAVVDAAEELLRSAILKAPQNTVIGIQVDYDCPTSKLGDYIRFIRLFKKRFPKTPISITALPTWLNSSDFAPLAKETSYFVLQLHSFRVPKSVNTASSIFEEDKAKTYLKKAVNIKHPFYISLPTYGYEVAYTEDGKFLGLRAEGAQHLIGEGIKHKIVMTEPEDIVSFLKYTKSEKFKHLKGILWFRLPLKTDEFNWDISTLVDVLNERMPKADFQADIIETAKGLSEIYVYNKGTKNIWTPVSFRIYWDRKDMPLSDITQQYKIVSKNSNSILVEGPAPKAAQRIYVGWFRNNKKDSLKISGVSYEKI